MSIRNLIKTLKRSKYKRYLIAIFFGAIVWNILFFLPVNFISTVESVSINTILTAFAFIIAPFICGYTAGYIGREKEPLLAVVAIILGYSPWALMYVSFIENCTFFKNGEIYDVAENYIYFLILSVIGGIIAMKRRKNKLRIESKLMGEEEWIRNC